MRNTYLLFALTAGVLFASACGHETPSATPVTEAEAHAFGDTYSAAILQQNGPAAAAKFDWNALSDRASEGTGRIAGVVFRSALKKQSADSFTQATARSVRDGDMSLLRVRTTSDGVFAVLRLITTSKGVNYHEMLLQRGADGVVRAADVLVYSSGGYLSESLRDFYLANSKTTLPTILNGQQSPFMAHIGEYHEFYARMREGKYQQAEAIYEALPPELRQQKGLMLAHVTVLQHLGGDAYKRALDEYRAAYPNAHGADLLAVNAFILRKQYDEALKAIDRVDAAVGGDPYQDSIRSSIFLARGDLDAARTAATRAIQREPSLVHPYFQLIRMALKRRDFPETARLLTALREHTRNPPVNVAAIPLYAEFVKSHEGRAWMAAQKPAP